MRQIGVGQSRKGVGLWVAAAGWDELGKRYEKKGFRVLGLNGALDDSG